MLIEINVYNISVDYMLFNSYIYIFLFLPITLLIYFLLNKHKFIQLSKGLLVIASLFFYSFWNIKYLILIVCSMLFNYSIGTTLNNYEITHLKINRKAVLAFGITINILLLSYYKYFDFFINNINSLFKADLPLLQIVLPLGISFFTFTQIAYLVDAYNKKVKEADFLNYALFVTFFPHLIAGPIIHHREMMPQFARLKNKIFSHKNLSIGLFLFSIGLFKKVILADNLSGFVSQGYDVVNNLNFFESWLVSISYTLQIYFDFSGYTDMALGVALMFNIILPLNFNSPYKAHNLQDFWRRWHMTLSRFLKDYIYIPLGGNRYGKLKTFQNLLTTFLLGGLWHGANWTFIVWGAIHGFGTIVHKLWKKLNFKMPAVLAIISTFIFINITWVFFRSENIHIALKMLKNMFGANGFLPPKIFHCHLRLEHLYSLTLDDITNTFYIIVLSFGLLFVSNSNQLTEKFKPSLWTAIITAFLLFICISNLVQPSEFLYFNF